MTRWVLLVTGAVVAGVLCSSVIIRVLAVHWPIPEPEWEDPSIPMRLQLSVLGTPQRDHVRLRLTVTNKSDDVIGWDKANAVFLRWGVVAEGSLSSFPPTRLEETPGEWRTRDRFLTIAPGDKYVVDTEITKPYRTFGQYVPLVGVRSGANEVAREGPMVEFQFPESVQRIRVRAYYSGQRDWQSFKEYFGFDEQSVHLWGGHLSTNDVTIDFDR
jgi:hypothetical protein